MDQNNYMNLDDMMEAGTSRNSFDMTSGRLEKVEDTDSTTNSAAVPKVTRVEPIMTGHVDLSNARPINVNDILPKREKSDNNMTADQLADLDAAIDRECNRITEFHKSLAEKQEEEMEAISSAIEEKEMEDIDRLALGVENKNDTFVNIQPAKEYGIHDINDDNTIVRNVTPNMIPDDDVPHNTGPNMDTDGDVYHNAGPNMNTDTTTYVTPVENVNKDEEHHVDIKKPMSVNILDGISNDELFDDDNEDDSQSDSNDTIEDLKDQIKAKIGPIKKTLDLSKFSITQKAVSAQKVMKLVVTNHQTVADWVLPNANTAISMTGLSGPEILKLNPENSNRNRMNTFRDMYQIIYNHVFDGNKPEFEVWLKQLRFVDLQHVYFCMYMATFNGSNFINYSCPKCKKIFLNDVDFKDMVVYADDNVKEKVKNLMKYDSTSRSADSYESTIVQISDNYALSIRTPSVWNVIMETATLSEQFLEQYSDLIDIITYIDAAYLIDSANQQLIPIDTKPDPNDMAKTAARRIATMYNIISKLNSSEYYALRSAINDLDKDANNVSYKIPGCKCPECGSDIPDVDSNPSDMLFTLHQLAAIGSM